MDKQTVCCFTGHRKLPAEEIPRIEKRLDEIITELTGQGVVSYLSGFALGFDTVASRAVIKARSSTADITLTAVLPCYGQETLWNEKDKQIYRQLLAAADNTIYVSEQPYSSGCMAKRNLFLSDNSGVCVAYAIVPSIIWGLS